MSTEFPRGPWWLPQPSPGKAITPPWYLPAWLAYSLIALLWIISGGYLVALAWLDLSDVPGLAFLPFAGITLATMIVALLITSHGHSGFTALGILPSWPATHRHQGRWRLQWWLVLAYGTLAVLAGNALYALAAPVLPAAVPMSQFFTREPFMHAITVGAVVVLAGAARRPGWEKYVVAAALTAASFLVPFGAGAVIAALPALALVWLYERTRRLTPLLLGQLIAALASTALADRVFLL